MYNKDKEEYGREYIMSEAFIYLWYDAPNKKYYLGKHKGSPDDTYTHSSTIWESFTKDNIPEGVTRRILAYGTDEEMCILEHELLVNRKKRCWDRYYNESLGDPRYVDQFGENNPSWKGGITYDMKEYQREYNQRYIRPPEYREYQKKRYATPEYREYQKKRCATPEYKADRQLYDKKRDQTPERKAYMREWKRKDYAKKKAERQGVGTLDAFLK